jgi:hypothetical protein
MLHVRWGENCLVALESPNALAAGRVPVWRAFDHGSITTSSKTRLWVSTSRNQNRVYFSPENATPTGNLCGRKAE